MENNSAFEQLKTIYRCCPFPVALLDQHLKIVWVNEITLEKLPSFADPFGFRMASAAMASASLPFSFGQNQPFLLNLSVPPNSAYRVCITPLQMEQNSFFLCLFFAAELPQSPFPNPSLSAYHIRESLFYINPALDGLSRLLEDHQIKEGFPFLSAISRSNMQILLHLQLMANYRELFFGEPNENLEPAFDLCYFLEQICLAVRDITAPLGILFHWSLPLAPLPSSGYPETLSLAIFSLLSNAFEHCEPGNSVEVMLKKSGNRAVFSVHDNGPISSPTDMNQIFTPDPSLFSAEPYGNGLSLALTVARLIVLKHDGALFFSTKKGRTAAYLTLPLNLDFSAFSIHQPATDYLSDKLSPAYIYLSNLNFPIY